MPENVSKKLAEYITDKALQGEARLFPICYSTARSLVRGLGAKLNVHVSPHDLRRYSATYASRNGVPLEVVSKVILRHQDLKTTQIYLGKIRILKRSAGWTIFTGNRAVQHNQMER